MDARTLKSKWAAGQPSPGLWLRYTDPTISEMLKDTGYDWVLYDAEHVAFDFQTLQNLLIALGDQGPLPLVRVPWNDHVFIKRILDIGAAGILVPHIHSAAEARAAVAACKYPPLGIRGTGPRRPSRYGRFEREYIARANDETIVLLMIETAAAVASLDEILAVPGLDGIILGRVDLAASMGFYGDYDHPAVQTAAARIIAAARQARVPYGDGRSDGDPAAWLAQGAQLISLGDDEGFVRSGAYGALDRFTQTRGQ